MFIEYGVLMTRLKIYTLKMLKVYNKDTRTTSVKVIMVPLLLAEFEHVENFNLHPVRTYLFKANNRNTKTM